MSLNHVSFVYLKNFFKEKQPKAQFAGVESFWSAVA